MRLISSIRPSFRSFALAALTLGLLPTMANALSISSPQPHASVTGQVMITASASEASAFHLELWDNGSKLGDVFSAAVAQGFSLPQGTHTLTVLAVTPSGQVIDANQVSYTVAAASTGTVQISSPAQGATLSNAVQISATANASNLNHMEVWDNGYKLGDVMSGTVNSVYVLPSGSHAMTIQAVAANGQVINKSAVNFNVQETCASNAQCDLDQLAVDDVQNACNPPTVTEWIANPCGDGVQGVAQDFPLSTTIEQTLESGFLPDYGNLTLNGHSLHLAETQDRTSSNVLFRGQSPVKVTSTTPYSHWTMDEYVYLPNPQAHQAFEVDAQYTYGNVWTKFYTECAFNMNNGKGYWAVFDSVTGGWIFLNGQMQGGQVPPVVPCNRSQFAQPWTGSGNPSFTGWHHIAWNFQRESDGTVTYQSLTFDGTTTQVNFHPNSATGGVVQDSGNSGALVQLDGMMNTSGNYNTVDAYVSQITLTHQQ